MGNRYAEALLGQVLIGETWNLAIYGKGCQQWTLHFRKVSGVQVLVMYQFFGFMEGDEG